MAEPGRKSVKRGLKFEGVNENNSVVQMDNERMRGNIMSVELALRREVEYQKRIKNLQKPSDYDSKEYHVPDQGVPSKVTLEESRQKFSSQYEACSQGVLLDPVEKQKPCQGPSTPIQGSLPLVGMKRKAPENHTCSSPEPEQQCCIISNPVPQTVNLWCKVCQIPCSGAGNFKQHCEGRKHKNKVELKHLKMCEDTKGSGPVWCAICSVPCTDGSAYKQHLDGKKHAACLSAVNNNAKRGKGAEIESAMEIGRRDYSLSLL